MVDVLGGQQLRELRLDGLQLSELLDVGELGGVDRTVLVLVEDQDVDDADRSGVDEPDQLRRHLAGEVLRAGRKLDDHVVNRPELVIWGVRHLRPFVRLCDVRRSPPGRAPPRDQTAGAPVASAASSASSLRSWLSGAPPSWVRRSDTAGAVS